MQDEWSFQKGIFFQDQTPVIRFSERLLMQTHCSELLRFLGKKIFV
jgi:hypothetical protein